ncbi:carboxyl-terminal protease [Desulfofarcimen acetoxidans DSM 771]|uniref:Carboxyl-terminal protease n=1 Tax=Desulfofarcimen acetoxidans (strain ATCC 49208 / DSM 771 / KCTC 5769 / VKM B-1644 / 5575) TaxID=485916 RepID=C8W0H0_DESAS|nr:S41 family peptidase [Desulfofarcimen acetoxidans]ACV63225.1 carboxyl-terminal protease [Desulfofarcimen acetoxidans DSM 771]
MRKNFILAIVVLMCLSLGQPAWAINNVSDRTALKVLQFEEILQYVYDEHLDKPEMDALINGAINGMLNSLNDPYSEYLTRENIDDLEQFLNGDFVGIGIILDFKDDLVYIKDVIDDSPAFKAGIKKDDIILEVDGEDITGLPIADVIRLTRGPKGSEVALELLRENKRINLTIQRVLINLPTVEYKILQGNTGYVALESFGSETAKEFSIAINSLKASGMQSLILDLRENTGGRLDAAADISGHFIEKGKPIVKMVDRNGKEDTVLSDGKAELKDIPVVILTDELTASASEVLAGALQDYKIAVLLGDRTFGKGVVQDLIPLETGGALKLTISKYLTPSGNDLNLIGIKPDRSVLTSSLLIPLARQLLNPPNSRYVEFNLGEHKVSVNGEVIENPAVPFISNSEVYVPLRFALEALFYEVSWYSENSKSGIRISGYNDNLVLFPNGIIARLNDQEINLTSRVIMKEGVSFIPVKVLEVLNISQTVNNGKIRLEN